MPVRSPKHCGSDKLEDGEEEIEISNERKDCRVEKCWDGSGLREREREREGVSGECIGRSSRDEGD